jgi:hypothetical protein
MRLVGLGYQDKGRGRLMSSPRLARAPFTCTTCLALTQGKVEPALATSLTPLDLDRNKSDFAKRIAWVAFEYRSTQESQKPIALRTHHSHASCRTESERLTSRPSGLKPSHYLVS